MRTGQVIKTYNGFYYVLDSEGSSYDDEDLLSCRVRGRVKKYKSDTIVTGDMIENEVLDDGTGVIEKCLPRKTLLFRPAVANVDQVILTFAARQPDIHPLLLNKFLVLAEWCHIPEIVICVNKCDLLQEEDESREDFLGIYEKAGYKVFRVSAIEEDTKGIEAIRELLKGKVTAFAGPSGVGKSSLLNCIDERLQLTTGVISDKIKRGKHTTRAARLMPVASGGIVVDTPGFSAAELEELIPSEELAGCFPEFHEFVGECYYNTCTHTHEPNCGIKNAVENGRIEKERYEAYKDIYEVLKENNSRRRRVK